MSQKKENFSVGELARTSSFQRVADAAGTADDRALEVIVAPGSTTPKKITPLSAETLTFNPRLLVVGQDTDGTVPNGKVRMRPARLAAAVATDAFSVGLAATQKTNLDSGAFANNPGGSTRYDLLYATISYGVLTSESVRQKPTGGGDPQSQTLTTQKGMSVVLSIAQNVSSSNPLASLPADPGDGSSYNFGLAMVALASGFTGGAINQAAITPLWVGGFVARHALQRLLPASIYSGTDNEKPTNSMSSRVGVGFEMFGHFKNVNTTPTGAAGVVIDNTFDWRRRCFTLTVAYMGGAKNGGDLSTENGLSPAFVGGPASTQVCLPADGSTSPLFVFSYNSGANSISFYVDPTTGALMFFRTGAPVDGSDGDLIVIFAKSTDKFLPLM